MTRNTATMKRETPIRNERNKKNGSFGREEQHSVVDKKKKTKKKSTKSQQEETIKRTTSSSSFSTVASFTAFGCLLLSMLCGILLQYYYHDDNNSILIEHILGSLGVPLTLSNQKKDHSKTNTTTTTLRKNYTTTDDFLSNYICHDVNEGYCHPHLKAIASERTHRVISDIPSDTVLLQLPRTRLLTDCIDALMDPWIQTELFGATHDASNGSTNPVIESGAYLAAYLLHRQNSHPKSNNNDDPFQSYYDILPSYEILQRTHPPLWSNDKLDTLLNGTSAYQISKGIHQMLHSEYSAFCQQSQTFALQITKQDYDRARILVMSRSFGTGPIWNFVKQTSRKNQRELEFIRTKTGIDLSVQKSCRALSPILDMWDHHPNAPTKWYYDSSLEAFVVKTHVDQTISTNTNVWVSYGQYTDSHLLSKFGFSNLDGSSHTEASLAIYHQPLDVGLGAQWNGGGGDIQQSPDSRKAMLLQYLSFDDGYDHCLSETNDKEAWEFKMLKLQLLQKKSNLYTSWNIRMGPRNGSAKPSRTTMDEQQGQTKFSSFQSSNNKFQFDGKKIVSTCRLITLHHLYDFRGNAKHVLQRMLQSQSSPESWFVGDPISDESEFLSLRCLARLTKQRLDQYPTTIQQDESTLNMLLREQSSSSSTGEHNKETEHDNLNGDNANVNFSIDITDDDNGDDDEIMMERQSQIQSLVIRVGEMQTLEMLHKIVSEGVQQKQYLLQQKGLYTRRLHPRHEPCH